MKGWKKRWKRPTFSRFSVLLSILEIVKDVLRKSVAFQVLAMNLLRRNVVQNARERARVQKCMGSVVLQFSSIKKVRPQNVWKETHTCSIWCFSCILKSAWLADAKSLRSFWFWKRSQEPLLGSFLNVKRYLQNPNSRAISGIFATFCRASELLAVQNIWMCKKIVECKRGTKDVV
jgi:hypothetical protein